MKKNQNNNVGKVLFFDQSQYDRRISGYNLFIEALTPLCVKFNQWQIGPMTAERLQRISSGGASSMLAELTSRLEDSTAELNPILSESVRAGQEATITRFRTLVGEIRHQLQTHSDIYDCPIVEGVPVLTDEFKQNLKDQYSLKIQNTEQSEHYNLFQAAADSVKALIDAGGVPGTTFDLHTDGLTLYRLQG